MIVFVLLASWRLGEYSADRENQIRQVQRVIVAVPVWSSWQWIKEWYEDSWGGNVLCIVEYEYLGMKWLWRTLWTDLCHDGCACMAGQSKLIKKKIICGFWGRSHGNTRVLPPVWWRVWCVPFPSFLLSFHIFLYLSFHIFLYLAQRINHHLFRYWYKEISW